VWAVKLNRFSLNIVGLWPEKHEAVNKNSFVSNIQAGIIFMIILLLVVPVVCSLVRVWSYMLLMIDNLQVTLPLIMVCLKIIIMRWKHSGIFKVI